MLPYQEYFYDLVLKKSLMVTIKSVDCYLELSDGGQTMTLLTRLLQNQLSVKELNALKQQVFNAKNMIVDHQNQQVVIARKCDFSKLSPETFALRLAQFHSDVIECRTQMTNLDEDLDFAVV